ncbi:MAG: hypothetical protein QW680_07665 [Pyrobaculum sp.]
MAQTLKLMKTEEVLEFLRKQFPSSPIKQIGYLTLEELIELSKPMPQEGGRNILRDRLKVISPWGYSPYVAFVVEKTYDPVVPRVVLPPPRRLEVLPKDMVFNTVVITVMDPKSCEDVVATIDRATGYADDYIYGVLCGNFEQPLPEPLPPPKEKGKEEVEEEAEEVEEEVEAEVEKEAVKKEVKREDLKIPKEFEELWQQDEEFRQMMKIAASANTPDAVFAKLGDAAVRLAQYYIEQKARRRREEELREARAPEVQCPPPPEPHPVDAIMQFYRLPESARRRVDAVITALDGLFSQINKIPESTFQRIVNALAKL